MMIKVEKMKGEIPEKIRRILKEKAVNKSLIVKRGGDLPGKCFTYKKNSFEIKAVVSLEGLARNSWNNSWQEKLRKEKKENARE